MSRLPVAASRVVEFGTVMGTPCGWRGAGQGGPTPAERLHTTGPCTMCSPSGRGHPHRDALPRAQGVVVVPHGRAGELDRAHPADERGEQRLRLQPRHVLTDALV